ncbi:hypothetical protein KJ632_03825, partial [Patescibacteria group bacterium]|nr:hypothetical protein [Patescibacteria group bacterium]
MKRLLNVFVLSSICLLFSTMTASAFDFMGAENLFVDEALSDDHYLAGGRAVVSEAVDGDLYIAGGDVTIEGDVTQDLMIAGGRVTVNGNVGDDLRVVGGQVLVMGNVGDDLIAFGGQVDISGNSVIGGSVVGGSGYLTLDGEVKEDVRGGFGMLIVNGIVGGNIIATVEEKLEIGTSAQVGGDLNYAALIEMDVPEEQVVGEIQFNKFQKEEIEEDVSAVNALYWSFRGVSFLSALMILILWVAFAPNSLLRAG